MKLLLNRPRYVAADVRLVSQSALGAGPGQGGQVLTHIHKVVAGTT